METMLTVINFKVLALSHLLSPSSLPACYICAGFGEKKSQYPNKGQNLKTGSFFGGGRGGWSASYIAFYLSGYQVEKTKGLSSLNCQSLVENADKKEKNTLL